MTSAFQDVAIERAILGGLLADFSLYGMESPAWRAANALKSDDMADVKHALVLGAMRQVFEAGTTPDYLSVAVALKNAGHLVSVGGPAFLMGLDAGIGFTGNMAKNVALVRDLARRRRLDAMYEAAKAELSDTTKPISVVAGVQAERIAALSVETDEEVERMGDADVEAVNQRWDDFYNGKPGRFLPVGIDVVDGIFKGFTHNLNLIGGKASIGKTAFVAEIAWGWMERGLPGGIFGLEDGTEWLWERHCSRKVGIPYADVGECVLHEYQLGTYETAYHRAREMLGKMLFTHTVSGLDAPGLLEKAKRWIRKGAKWILIDHGGRIEHEAKEKESFNLSIKRTVQALDDLAHNSGVPIIVNWHFNRPGSAAGLPTMEAFRESGYLEAFSGTMLGLWERQQDEGMLLLTCVKNRKGKRDWTVALERDAKHGLVHRTGGRVIDLKAEADAARLEEEAARAARGTRRGARF